MFLIINLISLVTIAVIFLLINIFDYQKNKLAIKNIKFITTTALLIALSVILNTFINKLTSGVVSSRFFQFRLGDFTLALIGFICGGFFGFLGGVANDFLGVIINNTGPISFFYTLASILSATLPFYLVRFFNLFYQNKYTPYLYISFAFFLLLLFLSAINPIIITLLYNLDFKNIKFLYLYRLWGFPTLYLSSLILLLTSYKNFHQSLDIDLNLGINNLSAKNNVNINLNYDGE